MAGRAGAILPIALGVVLARWGGAVGAPQPSQRRSEPRRGPAVAVSVDGRRGGDIWGGGCGLGASKYH